MSIGACANFLGRGRTQSFLADTGVVSCSVRVESDGVESRVSGSDLGGSKDFLKRLENVLGICLLESLVKLILSFTGDLLTVCESGGDGVVVVSDS